VKSRGTNPSFQDSGEKKNYGNFGECSATSRCSSSRARDLLGKARRRLKRLGQATGTAQGDTLKRAGGLAVLDGSAVQVRPYPHSRSSDSTGKAAGLEVRTQPRCPKHCNCLLNEAPCESDAGAQHEGPLVHIGADNNDLWRNWSIQPSRAHEKPERMCWDRPLAFQVGE